MAPLWALSILTKLMEARLLGRARTILARSEELPNSQILFFLSQFSLPCQLFHGDTESSPHYQIYVDKFAASEYVAIVLNCLKQVGNSLFFLH